LVFGGFGLHDVPLGYESNHYIRGVDNNRTGCP
jgi:hypothetical protein